MNDSLLDQLVMQFLSTLPLDTDGLWAWEAPEAPEADWPLTASIDIPGTPAHRLEVGLTRAAAERLSGAITGLTPEDLRADPGLAQDLTNEVANVLAGNLWPALPGATGIGLPQAGADLRPAVRRVVRAYAIDGAAGLRVSVGEQQE